MHEQERVRAQADSHPAASVDIAESGVVPSVRRRPHPGPAPLSAAEAQLWYFAQLAPGNPVYDGAFVITKRGPFEVGAFRAALNEIVRRHEILRSTFEVVDGEPVQVVQPAASLNLPLVDLSTLPARQRGREADSLAAADGRRPYQIDSGPLIRARLTRLAEDCHRLDLAMPHLVYDATSLGILMSELVSLYDAFAAGRASPLSDPVVQYADYAAWEREWTASADFAKRLDHWRRRLDDVPALHLPLDRPRPSEQRFRGATERFSVPLEVVDRLRAISREGGSTLFQAMTTAFAVLLHRYSGQEDVVFGTIVDQRERPELQEMVGYCVTPLVVRADVSGNPTFADVLTRIRDELLDAMAHQVPFERLVRELRPPRERGGNPIFQVVVLMQPRATAPVASWELRPLETEFGDEVSEAGFDLTFELEERPDGDIDGRLVYNTDLFERETARRMVDHWMTLLKGIATAPGSPVSELPMMSEQEQHRQLVEWNTTYAEYPRDRCVHELVAEQVRRTPDAVAVSDRRGRLTYAELDEQAGRLATHLRDLGVGPDGLVGICMDRSTDMLVALLGVLKAGGAFVPLEPDQPRERLSLMLGEARPGVVVTTAQAVALLPHTDAHVLVLDGERETWMSRPPAVTAGCGPRNLAYVLFTSGSTGVPKGVMVEHRSIVNQLVWRIDSFGLTPADRLLQKTSLGFDVSLWELFCPLLTGAMLAVLDPGADIDPRRLADAVRAERISALELDPPILEAFLGAVGADGCESLRLVATGGETLTPALARRFFEFFGPDVQLRNLYGPTEAVVDATWWPCDPAAAGRVPIGRPVANTQIYLLDAGLRPVPTGARGELCIGGDQVARGYLNRPELTAERFLDSPFVLGDRIYRTGDMARYRNDGAIEFLSRSDDQVKIRGVRVELGEVEAAIRTHPRVRQGIAAIRADAEGHQRLVAYLVSGLGQTPTVGEMRTFLAQRLPSTMVPSAVVGVDAIPLTHSGKTDRRALPDPDWRPVSTFRAARSATEAAVASIWARTLQMDRVGIDEDFFELGGHSLLAVRLLASVERELGKAVPLATFFGSATVAGMANVLEASQRGDEESALVVPVQSGGSAPVLFFVHPDESTMLTLRHFRGPLGADQRVVGLLPERIGRRLYQSRSVEDLAAPMLETIRSVQPHGPYHIAGFSFGGLLAYELAGRLREDGEPVGWLAILDCMTPEVARRLTWLLSPRGFLTRLRERGARRALRKVMRGAWRGLEVRVGRLRRLPTPIEADFDFEAAAALSDKYICRGHDAPLELFVSADTADMTRNPSLGWEDVHQGALTVHEVPGRHLSLLTEPHVHDVADVLSASLRRAQAAHVTSSS